uniref:Peptidase A1 domain-containing protein n=2 Tax=Corethron hystrix TaxID=216773 RepID=A0A7S1BJC6_9STRA|mmetsp:Transcript_28869/g.66053  ORF Transcript_28869/g.66053 Transcript_28869/m.66053 type:complete len:227 (+) Transcript_28869:882-1562(+)
MGIAMHPHSLHNAIRSSLAIPNSSFSLCLTRNGGIYSLGGSSPDTHLSSPPTVMAFTEMRKHYGWYGISIARMYVGNIEIKDGMWGFSKGKGAILDNGTTDTFLPASIAREFRRAWKSVTGTEYTNRSMEYTSEEFSKLPRIAFTTYDGMVWSLENYDYMDPRDHEIDKQGTYVWEGKMKWSNRVYVDEPSGAVLGFNTMIHREVFFDADAGVVGMARANCDYKVL